MHTKGPWKLRKAQDGYNLLSGNIWFMDLIGRWYPSDAQRLEHKANARLIAAAPELLEALETIRKVSNRKKSISNKWLADFVDKAIRKAKGE